MIKRSDLVAMRNVGKRLYSWEYAMVVGEDNEVVFHFVRDTDDAAVIHVSVTMNNRPVYLWQDHVHIYRMPRTDMPIELVTATGLRHVQILLGNDMQNKADIVSMIGIMVEGM